MKKVVISCGPIPAKLDSVKYLTNRFKGGLAFKTAKYLVEQGFEVTIVKWKYTAFEDESGLFKHIINIDDVFHYYKWFKQNVKSYDAVILAGAIANLTPSETIKGKFPSHKYQVGEKFQITFEIAPRIIDMIKKENKRCCLIGYKLFDGTKEELIKAAQKTLVNSKANIVFANTPATAKTKKIALFQDGTKFETNFEEHLQLIVRAINQEYYKTKLVKLPQKHINKINLAFEAVKQFEKTLTNNFGTIAIKIDDESFVTTSRGHKGSPVFVKKIDNNTKTVYANEKATLNAPALQQILKKYDYVIHRHNLNIEGNTSNKYLFPGTVEEKEAIKKFIDSSKANTFICKYHGYLKGLNFKQINWNDYYKNFPSKYFSVPSIINQTILKYKRDNKIALEVGCNNSCSCDYYIDPNVNLKNAKKLEYEDLNNMKFDLIILKNSINYLANNQKGLLIKALNKNGVILANTFVNSPDYRYRENEAIYKEQNMINHFLILNEENVIKHSFHITDINWYLNRGFTVDYYNKNSALIKYENK